MTNSDRTGKTTEHWAVCKEDCEKMAARNKWVLRDTEPDPKAKILKVKCIFEGDARFPTHWQEDENDG